MSQNYFKNLLPSGFTCLYLGNWRDDILEEAHRHDQIVVVNEDEALKSLNDPNSKPVVCVLSDFETAKYRKQHHIDMLYNAAKKKNKRVVIFGYRGLGIVAEKVS